MDLTNATVEDRLIVTESQTMRNRIRQTLTQAALNISNEKPGEGADAAAVELSRKRADLARRMLQSIDGWTNTMTPAIVAQLADTSDASIMNAIGGVFNSYLPS